MQIHLNKLIPIPLKEQFLQRPSGIWGKELLWHAGNYIKIKAASGSGKTTLVHLLYKLRTDYEGEIFWGNEDLQHIDANQIAIYRQQTFSIIFQDLRLFPNLTGRENINLNRVLQKPKYDENKIDEMAERLSVLHVLAQPAWKCSYGEQQRIAIIRALIQPFSWLIMDEPFSHLDHENILKAAALIYEECANRNAGFLLTDLEDDTHFPYSMMIDL